MRIKFFLILLAIFNLSCNSRKQPDINVDKKTDDENKVTLGNYYFSFDKVELYNIEIDDEKVMDFWSKKTKTSDEKLFGKIIGSHEFPKSISDTSFLLSIEHLGYKKVIIPEINYDKIKDIFRFKKNTIIDSYACPAIYRDILVFKLNQKNVGIAKICFGCKHHYIIGTNENTDEFGQGGDYEKLYELLYNKKIQN